MSDHDAREWFELAFRELYPIVYAHRDEDQARREVAFVLSLPERPPARTLDVGCGTGRHLRALRSAGLLALHGMDLAPELLSEARGCGASLVRADMRRLPYADASFELLTSFFTSFGFFATDAEDRQVLSEMGRVLKPGASFFMDFLDAQHVRDTLVPHSRKSIEGWEIEEARRIEDGRVKKKVAASNPESGQEVHYEESVRLYEAEELRAALEEVGLEVRRRFSDYEGTPAGEGSRLLIFARKS